MKFLTAYLISTIGLIAQITHASGKFYKIWKIESGDLITLGQAQSQISGNLKKNIQMKLNLDSKTIVLKAPEQIQPSVDDILNSIGNRFGSSIEIKKVDISSIQLGTQDEWM